MNGAAEVCASVPWCGYPSAHVQDGGPSGNAETGMQSDAFDLEVQLLKFNKLNFVSSRLFDY